MRIHLACAQIPTRSHTASARVRHTTYHMARTEEVHDRAVTRQGAACGCLRLAARKASLHLGTPLRPEHPLRKSCVSSLWDCQCLLG